LRNHKDTKTRRRFCPECSVLLRVSFFVAREEKQILRAVYPERANCGPFAEFTLSGRARFFAPLRMTSEGLRMTSEGLGVTANGLRVTCHSERSEESAFGWGFAALCLCAIVL